MEDKKNRSEPSTWTTFAIWVLIPFYWWWDGIVTSKIDNILISIDILFSSLTWRLILTLIWAINLLLFWLVVYQLHEWGKHPDERSGFLRDLANTSRSWIPFWLLSFLVTGALFGWSVFASDDYEMMPTIQGGDRIIWTGLAYVMSSPERGDIIAVKWSGGRWIGRIVGLPGETLAIRDNGHLVINGKLLPESYLNEDIISIRASIKPHILEADEYTVLLDHPFSGKYFGSRVKREDILGKAFLRYWPITRIGLLPDADYAAEAAAPLATEPPSLSWFEQSGWWIGFGLAGLLAIAGVTMIVVPIFLQNFVYYYNYRGIAYRKKGHYEQAIANYNRAIQLNPEDADIYNNRGLAYDHMGDYQRAIADYNQAIQLKPEGARAYNGRGWAYVKQGNYDQAITDCTRAIELDPDLAHAYHSRGFAYAKQGEHDRAMADFNRSSGLNPNLVDVYYDRGVVYQELGEKEKAIADFEHCFLLVTDSNLCEKAEKRLQELGVSL